MDANSQAVQSHITILQSVINRMATNSASCKAWCITIVSAILVLVADKNNSNLSLLATIPTLLFFMLDGYYLGLEKGFRAAFNNFIKKVHKHKIDEDELFLIDPEGGHWKLFGRALVSIAVWPFYLTLLVMTYVITKIIV